MRFLFVALGFALIASATSPPSDITDLSPPIDDEDFYLKIKNEIRPHLDFALQHAGKGVNYFKANPTVLLGGLQAFIPSVLSGIGFTETGIAAKSVAAYIQSNAGNVPARGVFAHMQSFAMGGYAVTVFGAAGKVYIAAIAVAAINDLLLEYGVVETDLKLVVQEVWKTPILARSKELWGTVEPGANVLRISAKGDGRDLGGSVEHGVEGIKKWFGKNIVGGIKGIWRGRQTEHQEL